ncbi:gamma carbonic anhydrase family protein [Bacteroidota bacterium]
MAEQYLFAYNNLIPKLHSNVFIAPGAKVIGDVEIGEYSSIWYNSVVRGDVHYIKIGEHTNIQDCSMLHVTNGKFSLNIGNRITIAHAVKLHGCTLKDLCLIGIGATLLDGSVVEENAIVAAGTVILEDFVVPSGKLIAGVPGKIIRDLSAEEIAEIENSAERYKEYAKITMKSLSNLDS